MEPEKELINRDLFNVSEEQFSNQISNDFIGDDFIEQLEWAMLLIQSKFKQITFAEYLRPVTANHFDKAYLMSGTLHENLKFFRPFTDLQVTPQIFPNINLKYLSITDKILLCKIKELNLLEKRHLHPRYRYVYEFSYAYYKKDTECFYGTSMGFELGDGFFELYNKDRQRKQSDIPNPISLHPNYVTAKDGYKYMLDDELMDYSRNISGAYQIALSMYYEWSIYIKEYDNIGLIIPIEPGILSEIYKTSMLKFDDKKRMIHFVKEHYRRKIANPTEDYSVFVNKYLRGEHKFNYRNFYTEIIPPKYDLNRVKTRKKFIDTIN